MRPHSAGDRRDLEDYEIPCNSNDLDRFQTGGAKTCALLSCLVVDFIGRLAEGEPPAGRGKAPHGAALFGKRVAEVQQSSRRRRHPQNTSERWIWAPVQAPSPTASETE